MQLFNEHSPAFDACEIRQVLAVVAAENSGKMLTAACWLCNDHYIITFLGGISIDAVFVLYIWQRPDNYLLSGLATVLDAGHMMTAIVESSPSFWEVFWQQSNDHRTVQFVNRSYEWVELTGTMRMQANQVMTSVIRIPPRGVYNWKFLGKYI
jgi:hypothetical protein